MYLHTFSKHSNKLKKMLWDVQKDYSARNMLLCQRTQAGIEPGSLVNVACTLPGEPPKRSFLIMCFCFVLHFHLNLLDVHFCFNRWGSKNKNHLQDISKQCWKHLFCLRISESIQEAVVRLSHLSDRTSVYTATRQTVAEDLNGQIIQEVPVPCAGVKAT